MVGVKLAETARATPGGQGVAGSNPVAPTISSKELVEMKRAPSGALFSYLHPIGDLRDDSARPCLAFQPSAA